MCVLPFACCPSFVDWAVQQVDEDRNKGLILQSQKQLLRSQDTTDGPSNADVRYKKQLYNKHGFNLAIFPGGFVKGVRDAFNPYAVLELMTVDVGETRIRGVETDLFLSMNSKGKLVGITDGTDESTVFVERKLGPYLAYLSRKYAHFGWHVAIKRTGFIKPGKKTFYPWGQHAIKFLHRKPYAEPHPLKQLENKHGMRLIIIPDGNIKGVKEEFNKLAVLEIVPGPEIGTARIRGVEANMYLAMNAQGELFGNKDNYDSSTVFIEETSGDSSTYLSSKWAHMGWHVGIKKSGQSKNGKRTTFPSKQKAIEFVHKQPYPLPINIDFEFMKESLPPIAFIDDDLQDGQTHGL